MDGALLRSLTLFPSISTLLNLSTKRLSSSLGPGVWSQLQNARFEQATSILLFIFCKNYLNIIILKWWDLQIAG